MLISFFSHGNKECFSCHGIKICVDWFVARGHKEITVFVPMWRKETPRPDAPIKGMLSSQIKSHDFQSHFLKFQKINSNNNFLKFQSFLFLNFNQMSFSFSNLNLFLDSVQTKKCFISWRRSGCWCSRRHATSAAGGWSVTTTGTQQLLRFFKVLVTKLRSWWPNGHSSWFWRGLVI